MTESTGRGHTCPCRQRLSLGKCESTPGRTAAPRNWSLVAGTGGLHLTDSLLKGKRAWGLAHIKTLASFLYLFTPSPSLKNIFSSQAISLRPTGAGRKTPFSKKYSYCHPTRSRKGGPPGFLALLVFTRVSEIRGGSQTPCRVLAGRDLGRLGQGEGLSIQKARHRDHKKETGGEMHSSESSCFCTRQLP